MNTLILIIQREYLIRIKKKSFLIMTLVIPLLFTAMLLVPLSLSKIKDSKSKHILVVDETGKYASQLKSNALCVFETSKTSFADAKSSLGKDIYGIIQITGDPSINPKAVSFYSQKQPSMDLLSYLNGSFSEIIKQTKLAKLTEEKNIDSTTIKTIEQVVSSSQISINTISVEDGLEKETSSIISSTIAMLFSFLVYFFVIVYGQMVMQGVIEEKSNRIAEVMISSVRPFHLMMGKITGIGLVGLTQLIIWIVAGAIGLSIFSSSASAEYMHYLGGLNNVNWFEIFTNFFVFFIGGYLIYASLFAMFGASVDNPQDAQQFVTPIMLIIIFALYSGMYSVQNPDGPLAFWCSFIPFTSPIVMMVRIPFGVPLVQILISVTILYASIFFAVKVSAKVYRVGILMYGKKPNFKELYKWTKYK